MVDGEGALRAFFVRADLADALQHLHLDALALLQAREESADRVLLPARRLAEPIAFCPGFLRGLAFLGDFALVGLSLPRDNRTFTGLALDDTLASRGAEARCAVMAIDLRSGDAPHWLRFEGVAQELYDVAAIPGRRAPAAIGFMGDEIKRFVSFDG